MTLKKLILCPNGAILAFDENGDQIEEVQAKGWFQLYLEYMESFGVDPTKVMIEMKVDYRFRRVTPFKTDDIWNYHFEEHETIKS